MATRALAFLAIVASLVAGASAQTISSNPRAYRAWLREQTDKDLAGLYESTSTIASMIEKGETGNVKRLSDEADRVIKLAHDAWSNVQLRKPSRSRPKPDPGWTPRNVPDAHDEALAARDLVREIAQGIATEQRARELDAHRRTEVLDKLEIVERFGLRLKSDINARLKR